MRVLIVKDDPDRAALLARLLKRDGHVCDHAGSVTHAIEAISTYPYDAALIDLRLPDGSGALLCLFCREKQVKCVAVTDDDTPAGFDATLRKPMNFVELKALLKSLK